MNKLKLGLEAHSVREAFQAEPLETLKRVKEIGYTGVEIPSNLLKSRGEGREPLPVSYYKEALAMAGLECYGILTSWTDVSEENIATTISIGKELGAPLLAIGSVPIKYISTTDEAMSAVYRMQEVNRIMRSEGFVTGYHNHESDHTHMIEGKSFFEHVFDNMPEEFIMFLDTGNAAAGGADPIELIKKYPNRSPYLHIKGYSAADGYLAYVGRDDIDWVKLIDVAVRLGAAKVFDIEFGKRGEYDPFERAKDSFDIINKINSAK